MAGKPTPPADGPEPITPKVKAKKGGISIVTLLIVVLAVAGASAGGTWFAFARKPDAGAGTGTDAHGGGDAHAAPADGHGDGHSAPAKPGVAQYLPLDPAFVVNTADEDSQHYLQTDVQVMARNADALEAVKTHMPHIRNNLLLLFGQQKTADVRDRAGREKLQAAALKEVQDVLKTETGKPGVEALYFTSFVTQ